MEPPNTILKPRSGSVIGELPPHRHSQRGSVLEVFSAAAAAAAAPSPLPRSRPFVLVPLNEGLADSLKTALDGIVEGKEPSKEEVSAWLLYDLITKVRGPHEANYIADIAYGHPWLVSTKTIVLSAIYLASRYKDETEIKLALLNFLESVVSFIDVTHMDVNLEERLFRLATIFDKDESPRMKREATRVAFLVESKKLGAQMSTRVPPFKAMPTNAEMLIAAPIMTPRPKISFEQLELNEILNENFGSSNAVIEDIYGRTAALYKQIPFSLFISPTQDHPFFTHLHKLTLFALQRILDQKKTVYRKRMQDYFIKVAHGLVEQGDFSSSFALFLGITHSAIERLTLAASPVLKSLKELFALENNHSALRARIDARLKEKQERDIPPLFLFCKDVEAMKAVRSENPISHEKLKGLGFLAWRFQNPKNYLPEEKPDRTDIKTRLDNCDYSEDKAAERSRQIKK